MISVTLRLISDRKSTRLNSSHLVISYAVFCLKKKERIDRTRPTPGAQGRTARGRLHDPRRSGSAGCVAGSVGRLGQDERPVWFCFFLMIRRPPRSTLLSLHDALPISEFQSRLSTCRIFPDPRPRLEFRSSW